MERVVVVPARSDLINSFALLGICDQLIGQRRTINKEDKGSWESWNKGTNAGTGIKEGFEPGFRIGVKKGAAE